MKTNLMISIDHELAHRLREDGNISQTINRLLQIHLFGSNTKEGITKEIKEQEDKLKKIKNNIELLKKKLIKANKPVVRYT